MMKKSKCILINFCLLLLLSLIPAPALSAEQDTIRANILFKQSINHELLQKYNATILNEYESISAVTADVPILYWENLKNENSIIEIKEDQLVQIEGQTVGWGHTAINVKSMVPANLTGKGVKIAIIDSGVDYNHPDLKIAGGICVLDTVLTPSACDNSYMDENGHGTHVAGIIAAQNNEIGIVGVAPNASIYGIKALDKKGIGSGSTIMAGIDWAIKNEMDIINLSLTTPNQDRAMKTMIDKAYQKGLLVIAAVGNEEHTTGKEENVLYPAKFESVIGVSAIDSNKQILTSSSVGKEVELTAPGSGIISTVPLNVDDSGPVDGYARMTGTSMASPFVTAMAALYSEKYPEFTNIQIRQLLQNNAQDLGSPGRDVKYGFGLVQPDTKVKEELITNAAATLSPNGKIQLTITALPEDAFSYNLYRNGQMIYKNNEDQEVLDYGVKGSVNYSVVPVNQSGEMKSQTRNLTVALDDPFIPDLTNDLWFTRNLVFLNGMKIMNGYQNGEIAPYKNVTRAEAVMMLGNHLKYDGTKRNTNFKDVSSESFASGMIQSAFEEGLLNGFPDGTFRPNSYVTRAEMSILIANAFQLSEGTASFSDVNEKVSGNESIKKIASAGITLGYPDGTFRPYEYMTRSTYAVFLSKAIEPVFK
ncbi:S8 family peptidase [Peribacillus acanthi]|uniref:S8 family peptidase n=1 Tax=Peribacillus acanthi TaxID=2171554 RepID=UPI000D3E24BA|nr:S8 family serine peptidase [Peribacillus acanthi]